MSHERSITVEIDGKYINLSTKDGRRQMSDSEAVEAYRSGRKKALGGPYNDLNPALEGAKTRSHDHPLIRRHCETCGE